MTHTVIRLLEFWALAFASLCLAVFLLNIFCTLIGTDLTLHNVRRESVIAAIASLIEAASVWVVVAFIPAAVRALVFPALLVAILYKLTHVEDWGRYEIVMLLVFQVVICCVGAFIVTAQFGAALVLVVAVIGLLALIGSIAKSLSGN